MEGGKGFASPILSLNSLIRNAEYENGLILIVGGVEAIEHIVKIARIESVFQFRFDVELIFNLMEAAIVVIRTVEKHVVRVFG